MVLGGAGRAGRCSLFRPGAVAGGNGPLKFECQAESGVGPRGWTSRAEVGWTGWAAGALEERKEARSGAGVGGWEGGRVAVGQPPAAPHTLVPRFGSVRKCDPMWIAPGLGKDSSASIFYF